MFDIINKIGLSHNIALFIKASIFSFEVSSLHNNKVFIIGTLWVRF